MMMLDRFSFALVGRLVCCMLIVHFCLAQEAQAQTAPQRLGSLQASGEVSLNGLRASQGQTVFPGDAVHTGADGAAVLTVPGSGILDIGAETQISIRIDQYFATLKQGTVAIRSFAGANNLEIRFGNFLLYIPSAETPSAATLTVDKDGVARAECRAGSVGVTAIQGASAAILHFGQAVIIGSDGRIQNVEPNATVPSAQGATQGTAPALSGRKRRAAFIIVGVAAAGSTGAAIALLHKSSPVSPSQP
jgi:hypothetical protein